MAEKTPTKALAIGAVCGAAAGLVVVLLFWMLWKRSSPPAPNLVSNPSNANVVATEAPPPVVQLDQSEVHAKLKRIGLALHGHHDAYRMFAPPQASDARRIEFTQFFSAIRLDPKVAPTQSEVVSAHSGWSC